jgi:hypothetical protein
MGCLDPQRKGRTSWRTNWSDLAFGVMAIGLDFNRLTVPRREQRWVVGVG